MQFYMANPAHDVTKITDEIQINPRWRTASQNISRNNKVMQNR
jgi:hypothetical protein